MASKDERPIVVGIGEALLDYIQEKDGTERVELGGAPLIFAYHAAVSHRRSVIVSAIGVDSQENPDEIGKDIVDKLKRLPFYEESKEYIFPVKNRQSGTADVNNSNKNKPQYSIKTNAAWADILWSDNDDGKKNREDKLVKLAKKTAAVYFTPLASHCGKPSKGTSKQAIDAFIDNVPKGCYKIFDVNLRDDLVYDEELIPEYIGKCNVLKANKEELDYLCGIYGIKGKDDDIIGKKLMKQCGSKVKIFILTKGKQGSTIFWREQRKIFSQSIHISVRPNNTIGAGDAMVGAFIGELLNGKTISEAHYIAALRSDKVCKSDKSMPDISGIDFFFSHAEEDNIVVKLFQKKFTDNGFTVWNYTTNKNPLEKSAQDDIDKAIENCKFFVYFSSKDANDSDPVYKEIEKAIERKKTILIIKLDRSPYPMCLNKYLYQKWYEPYYNDQLEAIYNKIISDNKLI